ncbi:MAG: hypothetical protein KA270_13875 [Saprospiraceae bacterium]|nr:hypothetical protein [Saprospiraceae bacterium]MBP6568254.1 hypothetical protein [Saprospiraceae bacterium]
MVAVIAGGVISFEKINTRLWLKVLKKYYNTLGKITADRAIYRGIAPKQKHHFSNRIFDFDASYVYHHSKSAYAMVGSHRGCC